MPKVLANVRERLVDELERMFAERSSDVSLRALARRAGVAVGTIYNYFPDKDDLVRTLFEREWSRTIERATKAIRGVDGPRARLRAMIEVVYDDAEAIVRTHPSRRRLYRSLERSRREAVVPYPFRPEGWFWVAGALAPLWEEVRGGPGSTSAPSSPPDFPRSTFLLAATLPRLVQLYPDERQRNVDYLISVLDGVLNHGQDGSDR